jgi:hypothetical protein
MPILNIDRDSLLDKVYELRSKLNFDDKESMSALQSLLDFIIQSESKEATQPRLKMKISR